MTNKAEGIYTPSIILFAMNCDISSCVDRNFESAGYFKDCWVVIDLTKLFSLFPRVRCTATIDFETTLFCWWEFRRYRGYWEMEGGIWRSWTNCLALEVKSLLWEKWRSPALFDINNQMGKFHAESDGRTGYPWCITFSGFLRQEYIERSMRCFIGGSTPGDSYSWRYLSDLWLPRSWETTRSGIKCPK